MYNNFVAGYQSDHKTNISRQSYNFILTLAYSY